MNNLTNHIVTVFHVHNRKVSLQQNITESNVHTRQCTKQFVYDSGKFSLKYEVTSGTLTTHAMMLLVWFECQFVYDILAIQTYTHTLTCIDNAKPFDSDLRLAQTSHRLNTFIQISRTVTSLLYYELFMLKYKFHFIFIFTFIFLSLNSNTHGFEILYIYFDFLSLK